MSAELLEKPRGGKYCPRCRTMAHRDQATCGQCGHRFRTGAAITPSAAETLESEPDPLEPDPLESDPLHRTMQFTLPPRRPVASEPPVRAAGIPRRTILTASALAFCLAAFVLWLLRSPAPASPVGVWETTLSSKTSANAQLQFALKAGGTGEFSWRESGPASLAGQTPLRWRLNPDQTLSLALTVPPSGDPVSQTLAGIFSSHPWPWHVEPSPRRLTLGTLVFTEKS